MPLDMSKCGCKLLHLCFQFFQVAVISKGSLKSKQCRVFERKYSISEGSHYKSHET